MYKNFARLCFCENRVLLNAEQIEIVVQVNRDFAQNGNRKCDGETSESVPYSSLAVRSHLAVKIGAPRVLDSWTP